MKKSVSYQAVSVESKGSVFGVAFVSRTDCDGEDAEHPLPYAILRVTEVERDVDGTARRSMRKEAVAFALSRQVANLIVGALNVPVTA